MKKYFSYQTYTSKGVKFVSRNHGKNVCHFKKRNSNKYVLRFHDHEFRNVKKNVNNKTYFGKILSKLSEILLVKSVFTLHKFNCHI